MPRKQPAVICRNSPRRSKKEDFVIARATPADIQALEKLRRDQQLEQMIAYAGGAQPEPERYFGRVQDGELAAVTRRGDVFRLNPQHLKEVDKRLGKSGVTCQHYSGSRGG